MPVARREAVRSALAVTPADPGEEGADRMGPRPRRGLAVALSGAVYLVLAVFVWSHAWLDHPTSTTVCGCGDSSLFTWFLNWPVYALGHGLDPLYSSAMGYPHGVNLLSNTSVLAIGFGLAPVTWLFGPVASLNVALTLSPFLSSSAMLVLLLRWCRWAPAAFMGGLLYGFSPYVLFTLTNSHLMLGMAPVPPLVVLALDEILVRQSWPPRRAGLLLGGLVVVQFFVGTETLAIVFVMSVIGVILLVAGAAALDVHALRARAGYVARSLATTVLAAGVLLAYPLWFTFAGPAHLSGDIWGPGDVGSFGGTALSSFVLPAAPDPINTALDHQFGGYQAPTFSGQYLGFGVVVVVLLGAIIWRRDRRLSFFAVLGAASAALSLGLATTAWTPWRLFVHLPPLENVIPMRFLVVTYLCAAVTTALVVDHAHDAVRRRTSDRTAGGGWSAARGRTAGGGRLLSALVGTAVGAVVLVPVVAFLAGYLPLTTQAVVVPKWFASAANRLPPRQVLLVFPAAYAVESSESWQVAAGMRFAMVNQGGPGGILSRAGSERRGQAVLASISYRYGPPPRLVAGDILAVRDALEHWGVTAVVLPDQPGLPAYDRVPSVTTVAAVMTGATGALPVHTDHAWVWRDPTDAPPAVPPGDQDAIDRCTTTASGPTADAVPAVGRCMLRR